MTGTAIVVLQVIRKLILRTPSRTVCQYGYTVSLIESYESALYFNMYHTHIRMSDTVCCMGQKNINYTIPLDPPERVSDGLERVL